MRIVHRPERRPVSRVHRMERTYETNSVWGEQVHARGRRRGDRCICRGSRSRARKVDTRGILMISDWSHKHIVFSTADFLGQAWRLQGEPRYRQQAIRRAASEMKTRKSTGAWRRRFGWWPCNSSRRTDSEADWGQSLGAAARREVPIAGR